MASGSSPAYFFDDQIANPSDIGSEYEDDRSDMKSDFSEDENENFSAGRTTMMGAIHATPSFAHNRKRTERSTPKTTLRGLYTATPQQSSTPASRSESSKESKIHSLLLKKMDMLAKQNELIMKKLDEVLAVKSKECSTAHISKSKLVNVPAEIKSAVHDGYKCGREAKNLNWTIKDGSGNSLKHNSNQNLEMTEHILNFVKGIYPSAQNGVITVSVERYFESVKHKEHKNIMGKTEQHKEHHGEN